MGVRMADNAQPLNIRTPIVNSDGSPTDFMIRWAKQFSENTLPVDGVTAGNGIAVTAGPTVALDAVLDDLNDVDTTTVAPTNGQLLAYDSVSGLWKPKTVSSGSQPWYWAPPVASDFTAASADATLPVMTDDADIGLMINFGTHVTGNISRHVYKALPSSGTVDWSVIVKLNFNIMSVSNITGIMAWESATGKTLRICQNATTREIRADRTTTMTSALTNVAAYSQSTVPEQASWLKISFVASTGLYSWQFSTNGKQWNPTTPNTIAATTAFTTRADRVALFAWSAGTNAAWTQFLACQRWTQSW